MPFSSGVLFAVSFLKCAHVESENVMTVLVRMRIQIYRLTRDVLTRTLDKSLGFEDTSKSRTLGCCIAANMGMFLKVMVDNLY